MRWGLLGLVVLATPLRARADAPCRGDYAEDLSALSARGREIEARSAPYSYAVRATSTYECVSYGGDGNLRTSRSVATAYGTAFGYRHDDADTLLLTNDHVAEWPAVTDADHVVDGIPAGCKRVAESLKIVDGDHDDYAPDDIALTRVVAEPTLDVAILRAHAKLEIIPWRVGHSAALASRVAVEVKGFPLGEFRATNVGKVIAAYNHDEQGDWNHDDFVVDALLSSGGSGSPVLAVSCKTGELELVGIFHAHYTGANALNVVVSIDQVRDLMTTLKRSVRRPEPSADLDAAARTRFVDTLHDDPDAPFFTFGGLTASVHARADGGLVYVVFPADFPRTSRPLLAIADVADAKSFGTMHDVYVSGPSGLVALELDRADADTQQLLTRVLATLRADAVATLDYRRDARTVAGSRDAYERTVRRRRTLARTIDAQRDLAQSVVELASRAGDRSGATVVRFADLAAGTPPAAAPTLKEELR